LRKNKTLDISSKINKVIDYFGLKDIDKAKAISVTVIILTLLIISVFLLS